MCTLLLLPLLAVACTPSDSAPTEPQPPVTEPTATEPETTEPEEEGGGESYIFDPAAFHSFELEVAEADWAQLLTDPLAEQYVPAAVWHDGERYGDAAVRFKGSTGTLEGCFDEYGNQWCPKLSLKVSFNEYDKDGRFFGLRKLILHSGVADPSLMRERLSYGLFRAIGLPASRVSHATVSVNGENYGVYNLVEYVDHEFLESRWDNPDGNLYKEIWPLYSDPQAYRGALRTNEDEGDVSDMMALFTALETTTPATFEGDVAGLLDLDQMGRYLAVDHVTSNWDGVSKFYCHVPSNSCGNHNFYWYSEPGGAMHVVVWDLDNTFGEVNMDLGRSWSVPSACQILDLCTVYGIVDCPPAFADFGIIDPQCDPLIDHAATATRDRTLAALAEMRAGPLRLETLVADLDSWRAQIRDAVEADPFGPGLQAFDEHHAWLVAVLEAQIAEVDALLAE